MSFHQSQSKEGYRCLTHVYKGMWKITESKKIEVALKFLKQESREVHLKDFHNLIGQWVCLRSPSIVKLFGVSFSMNDICLVMENFKLGPLNEYLKNNKSIIDVENLMEATSSLASALWHLQEKEMVHGRIRCRKLLVCRHDENDFLVKLTDPGIHTKYEPDEVHWIPVENYSNVEKKSILADVWALATTMYEFFIYGSEIPTADHMQTMRWYLSGKRLPQPASCPNEVYTLMKECWHADPDRRKQPQEICRDVNRLICQHFSSRKKHLYDTLGGGVISVNVNGVNSGGSMTSSYSVNSIVSNNTAVTEMVSGGGDSVIYNNNVVAEGTSQEWLMNGQANLIDFDHDPLDLSQVFSKMPFPTCDSATPLDSLNSMQSILELDSSSHVVLKGLLGRGFYGDVYKGTLEDLSDGGAEPRTVAVKKLRLMAGLTDFQREINIMKTLKHPNIVEVIGVVRDPDLLLIMEYVPHGSLQCYLKHQKDLSIGQLLKFSTDIAMGMDYLGRKNLVHRDLAARNILVVDETLVKISDFGLAQFIGTDNYYMLSSPHKELPVKWYALESIVEGKFSFKSDVWSYGVTLWEMFAYGEDPPILSNTPGKIPPGQEQQAMVNALQSGTRLPCTIHCPNSIYANLIRPCWEANPHDRPTFQQLYGIIRDLQTRF